MDNVKETSTTKDSSPRQHQTVSTTSFMESVSLDETLDVLKKRLWSLRSAWKGIAENLCRYTVSPTAIGYSSVSIHEDGYVNDSREDVEALKKADACLTTPARRYLSSSIPEENILLVENESEEEDVDLAFAESIERNHVEEAPLTKSAK